MFGNNRHLSTSIEDGHECQRLATAAVASMAQVRAALGLIRPPLAWPEMHDDLAELAEEATALYEHLAGLALAVDEKLAALKAEAEAKQRREGSGDVR